MKLEPLTRNIKAKLELFVCESGPRAVSLFRSNVFFCLFFERPDGAKDFWKCKRKPKAFFWQFMFFLSLFAPLYSYYFSWLLGLDKMPAVFAWEYVWWDHCVWLTLKIWYDLCLSKGVVAASVRIIKNTPGLPCFIFTSYSLCQLRLNRFSCNL